MKYPIDIMNRITTKYEEAESVLEKEQLRQLFWIANDYFLQNSVVGSLNSDRVVSTIQN